MKNYYNPFAHTYATRKAQLENRLARLQSNLIEAKKNRSGQNSGVIVGLNFKIIETRQAIASLN